MVQAHERTTCRPLPSTKATKQAPHGPWRINTFSSCVCGPEELCVQTYIGASPPRPFAALGRSAVARNNSLSWVLSERSTVQVPLSLIVLLPTHPRRVIPAAKEAQHAPIFAPDRQRCQNGPKKAIPTAQQAVDFFQDKTPSARVLCSAASTMRGRLSPPHDPRRFNRIPADVRLTLSTRFERETRRVHWTGPLLLWTTFG
jgi:hypothetical protein